MFSTLEDFINNQKESLINDEEISFDKDNMHELAIQLNESLHDDEIAHYRHHLSHIFKLGLLENEVLKQTHAGYCGFTNYRFYIDSVDGFFSIPLIRIVKYINYQTSNSNEIDLAKEYLDNKDEAYDLTDIVWKTPDGNYSFLDVNEVPHERYLRTILNEGESLELSEEAINSIYKTKNTLKKKYSEIETWTVDDFTSKFVEAVTPKNDEKNTKQTQQENLVSDDISQHSQQTSIKLYTGERKYTSVEEDKYSKTKTITWNSWSRQPSPSAKLNASASLGIIWAKGIQALYVSEGIGMGMRLVEKNGSRGFVIDYEFHDYDWLFLHQGNLKILIDGDEVVELPGKNIRTEVFSEGDNGGKIFEQGYWPISETNFWKVCDSDKVEVRIRGRDTFLDFEESNNLDFQFMLRSMFSECYESDRFKEYVQEKTEIMEKKQKSRSRIIRTVIAIIVIIFIILLVIAYA